MVRRLLAPLALVLALAPALGACSDDATAPIASAELVLEAGKADGASELRVRVDGLTLWLTPALTSQIGERQVFTLTGRTSRNLSSVFSFVPDDGFGQATTTSARKFAVELSRDEMFMLTPGLGLLVRLDFGSKTWFAQLGIEGRLSGFSGSSKIWIASALAPVQMDGTLAHRTRVQVPRTTASLAVTLGTESLTAVRESDTTFRLDFSADDIARAMLDVGPVTFTATDANGKVVTKTASLGLGIGEAELTTLDPYDVWPYEGCQAEVAACVAALPGCVSGDTESCGTAREVTRCASSCPQ